LESFIQDPVSDEVIAEIQPVTFQIVESGTKRRKSSLIDSLGFSYNVHSRRPYATYWQCTVRPKGNPCKASVTERNGVFRPGQQSHNHIVEVGAATAAKIVSKVKSKALEEKFKPASAIVDEVMLDELIESPCPVLPKPMHVVRAANRLRQKLRPEHPKDMDFELVEECLPPGFLQADLTVKQRRHLIFARQEQLNTLAHAKSWYVNGTFKFVRHPFNQLLTVNAFVRSGEYAKQIPLAFVLMTSKKEKDYKKV